jgi:small subunit ribosomal protein S6
LHKYETMYIVDADLNDEQLEPIIEKYKKIVTSMGGVVLDAGKWEGGRRRLAYSIAGRREGIYILMNFDSGTDVPKELDRVFKISDDVFRHLIVTREEGAPPPQSSYQPPAPAQPEPSVVAAPAPESPAEPVAEKAAEAPAVEAPAVEAPAVEAPVVEAPVAEAPAAPAEAEPEAPAEAEPEAPADEAAPAE